MPGSAVKFSKQCPPLRAATHAPRRTASWTARTTCSVEPTTWISSGDPVKRRLSPSSRLA